MISSRCYFPNYQNIIYHKILTLILKHKLLNILISMEIPN